VIIPVHVVDNTDPSISFVEGTVNPLILEYNDTYIESSPIVYDDNYTTQLTKTTETNFELVDNKVTVLGDFYVKYIVTDESGNSNSITRNIYVRDRSGPVVTIDGGESVIVDVGSGEYKPDVSIIDDYQGTLNDFSVNSNVNTEVVGEYTYKVTAVDSNNNTTTVSQSVLVRDREAPVITLEGDTEITLHRYTDFVEDGYSATDNYDQSIAVTPNYTDLNNEVVGEYHVYYTAKDESNNTATVRSRKVNVIDEDGPIITLNGSSEVTIELGQAYTDAGASAKDANSDVDIVGIDIDTSAVITSQVGIYQVVITAVDDQENTSKNYRYVRVVDTISPVLQLIGNSPFYLEYDDDLKIKVPGLQISDLSFGTEPYQLDSISQSDIDNCPFNVTTNASEIDTKILGEHTLIYTVSDPNNDFTSSNTKQITRQIIVEDTLPPVITMLPNEEEVIHFTIEKGDSFSDPGATAIDARQGEVQVITETSFTSNNYYITYRASDNLGNSSYVVRTITFVDTTDPDLSLKGENPMVFNVNDNFVDPGFTCIDLSGCDTTIVGNVDTSTVGVYYLDYTSTDFAGNTSETKRRIIHVENRSGPECSLIGDNVILVVQGDTYQDQGLQYDNTQNFDLVVNTNINTNEKGYYYVEYTLVNSQNNSSTTLFRSVIII
jgi:hypothetical protein